MNRFARLAAVAGATLGLIAVGATAASAFTGDEPATRVEARLEATYNVDIRHEASDSCGHVRSTDAIGGCATIFGSQTAYITVVAHPDHYESRTHRRIINTIMRHEVAHSLIAAHCGTATPPIAGSRYESVTDAYAILYLNADPELIASFHYGAPTSADYDAARSIRSSVCSDTPPVSAMDIIFAQLRAAR